MSVDVKNLSFSYGDRPVLHDISFSDRILAIQRGRVLMDGRPEEVLTEATMRKLYGVEVEVMSICHDKARFCIPKTLTI